MEHRYDAIINLPHHRSAVRPPMTESERAAQFSPFAALTGYEDAIREAACLTDERALLSDERADELNREIQMLRERLPECPKVRVTYFLPDRKKTGGRYLTVTGRLQKIDEAARMLVFLDGSTVPIDDIFRLEGEFPEPEE